MQEHKNIGKKGFGEIIEKRHEMALYLADLIEASDDFVLINRKIDINAVAFVFTGGDTQLSVDELHKLNRDIHERVIKEGKYHLHQFSVPDPGIIQKDEIIYPLRYMSGNPNITSEHILNMLDYIKFIGEDIRSTIS